MEKKKFRIAKKHVILAVMLLLVVAGCSAADETSGESAPVRVSLYLEEPSDVRVSDIPGLSLTIEEKELSGSDAEVKYTLENATDTAYTFGPGTISIEGLRDGEWYRLASRTGEGYIVADSIAAILEQHGTHSAAQSFYPYGDLVPAGTYRLVIGLTPDGPDNLKEYLAAEFSVAE